MTVKAPLRPLMLVVVTILAVSACSSDTPTSGPVTIETVADFDVRPVVGTFEVTDGADILGCSSGTFEDAFDAATEDVTKIMTCGEGDSGTFTIVFDPDGYDTGPGEQNGPWRIVGATSDFSGLQGDGDFWAISDVETLTGDIERAP